MKKKKGHRVVSVLLAASEMTEGSCIFIYLFFLCISLSQIFFLFLAETMVFRWEKVLKNPAFDGVGKGEWGSCNVRSFLLLFFSFFFFLYFSHPKRVKKGIR